MNLSIYNLEDTVRTSNRHSNTEIIRLIKYFGLAALLTGCANDDLCDLQSATPDSFTIEAGVEQMSRAEIIDITELSSMGFGLFATETGENQWTSAPSFTLAKNNSQFKKLSGEWTSMETDKWPKKGKYFSLFAYAPYCSEVSTDGPITSLPTIDNNLTLGVKVTDQSNQQDLLVAEPVKDLKIEDETTTLTFSHAMSLVRLMAVADDRLPSGTQVRLVSAALSSTGGSTAPRTVGSLRLTDGTWTAADDQPAFDFSFSGEGSNPLTVALSKSSPVEISEDYITFIPDRNRGGVKNRTSTVTLTAECQTSTDGTTWGESQSVQLTLDQSYERGVLTTYVLHVGDGTLSVMAVKSNDGQSVRCATE